MNSMSMRAATLNEIKEYVKNQLDAFISERVPHAASLAMKTAITFLGTALGIFLRELLHNPEFQTMVEERPKEEVNAALRAALTELWGRTYEVFFSVFKQNIGTSALEAHYFAEQVMRALENEKQQQETEHLTEPARTEEQTSYNFWWGSDWLRKSAARKRER